MYRCKNWFCARSNNNNYVDVALSEAPPTASTTTTPHATNSRNSSASNNNNVRSNSSKSNQQTNATTAGVHRGGTGTTTHTHSHPTTAHCSTDEPSPPQAHVVTFLDETTASGSNGAVTSSRLVTTAELHQAHMLEHHSNLDAIEQADDFIYGPGAGLSLCDDSLPSAKNCYRLVMLGYVLDLCKCTERNLIIRDS